MPDSIGPAGNATQVINVPPPQPAAENQQPAETDNTQQTEQTTENTQTERVNPESNVGNNVDTTA